MLRHRHYSWPFSGPNSRAQELSFNAESVASPQPTTLYKKRPISPVKDTFHRPFNPDTFIYSSSDEEDMYKSAGIVPSKAKYDRRHRNKRRRRCRNEKNTSKKCKKADVAPGGKKQGEVIVSSITEANQLPTALLRRFIWPRLEKARQFLILPLHFASSLAGEPRSPVAPREEKPVLSCASMPTLSDTEDIPVEVEEDWKLLRPGRRHRRCHSEQPRAWREPSPGLWTLAEE